MAKKTVVKKVTTADPFVLLGRRLGRIEKQLKQGDMLDRDDGFLGRVDAIAVQKEIVIINAKLDVITEGLFGNPGNPDRKGFVERLRDVEAIIANAGRAMWIAIGAVIVSLIALFFK